MLMAGIAASANAGTIFSNLDSVDGFATSSGWVVGNRTTPFGSIKLEVAAAFTPTSDAVFTGADFAAELLGESGDLTIALTTTGPSGTPDTTLETFTVTAPAVPSLVSVQSILSPVLAAGTEYWLDVSVPTTAIWWLDNDQGVRGPVAENQNGLGFVRLSDFGGNPPIQPAFRVTGDSVAFSRAFAALADPPDAPEPSPRALLVVGFLSFGALRMIRNTG
jgi:hypothetical protein